MTDPERPDPTADPTRTVDLDPGAFTGNRPERAAETIPGGIGPKDERIAAHSTQAGDSTDRRTPEGHREGAPADDAAVREAGQDR
jgi:hypothetical protein